MTDIPRDLASHLGLGTLSPLGSGGSGALTLRHERDGHPRFVKYMPHRGTAVDGHEAQTLVVKARQVDLIRSVASGLQRFVPPVVVTEIPSGFVLTSSFIVGRSPVETLLSGGFEAFESTLRQLLDVLGNDGYACRSSPVGAWPDLYVARAGRRLAYLAEHLVCTDGLELAETADAIERVAKACELLPDRHYFPAHGDLNLFNVIETSGGSFAMIDQRGVLDDWDPVYDVAKMLTTLWIQTGLERGLYRVHDGGTSVTCEARYAAILGRGIEILKAAVSTWSFGEQLEPTSGRRWLRILFAAAVHAICEAACRVSVSLSPFCQFPAHEIEKAMVYLNLGRQLLGRIEHDINPQVPVVGVRP